MRNNENHQVSEGCLNWLRDNVVKEIPIVGHTLASRQLDAFAHDMQHFFSMLVGMVTMMEIPMPESVMMEENKTKQFFMELTLMLLYMYIGIFTSNVLFNVGRASVNLYRQNFNADDVIINDEERLLHTLGQ